MARCPKCKRNIGCSCKLRTASDGTKGCTKCIPNYETSIKSNKTVISNGTDPIVLSVTAVQTNING